MQLQKIISFPETLAQCQMSFEEIKKKVETIRTAPNYNHSRVAGGIDWGSSLINTFKIAESNFCEGITGEMYSVLSTKEKPFEMFNHTPVHGTITFKKIILEHVCGYRYSNPNILISELRMRLSARSNKPDAHAIDHIASHVSCDINRIRFSWQREDFKGVLVQETANATPQLYCFDQKGVCEEMQILVKDVAEAVKDFCTVDPDIFSATDELDIAKEEKVFSIRSCEIPKSS